MTRREQHIFDLNKSDNWINYLKKHSGLPGKRANLELLDVVIEFGDEQLYMECLKYNEVIAPTNTQGEYVAMCGVAGLGKLFNEGDYKYYSLIKKYTNDTRWRVREGVVFALQVIGKEDFDVLIKIANELKLGNSYEKRAIVAGLCEPILLKKIRNAEKALKILEEITNSIEYISNRKSESFRVLRKGLAYGISVAIVACPDKGKELFETLLKKSDKDIKWILKENLKKKRLEKMDSDWTGKMKNTCV